MFHLQEGRSLSENTQGGDFGYESCLYLWVQMIAPAHVWSLIYVLSSPFFSNLEKCGTCVRRCKGNEEGQRDN